MNDLDNKIREALRKEDAELAEAFAREPSMFELMMETFRGRHRKLVWLTTFWMMVFVVLGAVSAVQFFKVEEIRPMLMWAVAFGFCANAVAMMKSWWWMEMNKNAITREVKRLELQIAKLTERLAQ